MEVQQNISLKEFAWWKIGGPADFFCQPESVADVQAAVDFAHARGHSITVLGGGTNVLIHDAGVEGLVICMRKLVGVQMREADGRLHVEALTGTPKSELTKIFMRRKLAPALFLCGLPGDVGGGVVMNAGVSEKIVPREFVEIVDWVDVLSLDAGSDGDCAGDGSLSAVRGTGPGTGASESNVRRWSRDELQWKYRSSSGWQPGIVVAAGVSWPVEPDDEIPRKVKDATKNRLARQPLDLPSCGSTFKNPSGDSAGSLIERAGLKGYKVGGAQVSPKHANFIVNIGGASAADVSSIIQHVRVEVKRQFAVELETEVRFLGRWR